jgi:hypothetical protein
MSSTTCTYRDRDAAIVAYIYDDSSPEERERFARHLRGCASCLDEVAQLAGARRQLAHWAPPSVQPVVSRHPGETGGEPLRTAAAADRWAIPVWAQVAAAMLCLGIGAGIGAGIANLRLSYGSHGLSVAAARGSDRGNAQAAAPAPPASSPAVTHAELTALEQQLRSEIASARPTAQPARQSDQLDSDDVLRRVRGLIRDSEQRQQRELALRVAEVARDVQAQRQADLVRIDRTLGVLQNNTGLAVRRQEQLLNSLAVRVSQRQ